MASNLPNEPVDDVEAIICKGARVMQGTWENGETHVLIAEAYPIDPEGASLLVESDELAIPE